MEIQILDTLYKRDENGNVRVWRMERRGDEYRTVSGVQNGAEVYSEWKRAKEKGIGKARRDSETQAINEIASIYKRRLERDYHRDISSIDNPIIFEPMLAGKYKDWASVSDTDSKIYAQPKLDGMRCIVNRHGLWSRNGKQILGAPHIFSALRYVFDKFPDAILDGELYNHEFRDDFNTIISAVKKQKPTQEHLRISEEKIQYHVYDVAHLEDVPFGDRFEWICQNVNEYLGDLSISESYIVTVDTALISNQEELDNKYGAWLQDGYEGQMIRLDSPYENRRTDALLKRKEFVDEEFPLIEINEGQGNWGGVAKSVTCALPDGRTFNAGIKGNRDRAADLLNETNWTHVTIRYQNLTPDGIPRFGVAVKFWDREAVNLDR